ncbi:eukaryotic peptide chain release factor GTP-binding subunit-like [Spinacia oleracea]|uniref:Eukaryotic peptide chain release factor GTP-binding subunit-like n=1 Tax=Spinacia oleracea TaxID=3562 RepID=A0A9R0JYZ0_SPIOL|nr:eukaryotic peptide chain release factor GTP-binding subunit-like [Spinacia oleracea]
MSFAQRDREPLRDYLTRFNNESITIPNLQQEVAVLPLMRGMQECEFKKYLSRKSYINLGDVLHKANEYIRGDEMMKISSVAMSTGGNAGYNPNYNNLQAGRGGNSFNQNNNQQGASQKNQNNRNVNPQGQRPRQDRRESRGLFDNYTPLNTPRTTIYNINNKMDEDCRDLKDNIEDMVRKGYFSQYRARQGNGNHNPAGANPANSYRPQQQQNQQQYPRIEQPYQPPRIEQRPLETSARAEQRDNGKKPPVFVISGGPVHGGTISGASRSLEKHKHMDCRGIIFPHDDPLVLTIDIENADVNRVLVDGGSSTNIIFWDAFKQLHIPEEELTRVNYPVIGFSGSTVYPEGSIRLQVKVGEGSEMRDLMVDFLIIKVLATYNVIIGRPFIHDAQAKSPLIT